MGTREEGQALGAFLRLGFRLGLLYGVLGLGLEVIHRQLPPVVYEKVAGLLSALPRWLLSASGLDSHLTAALAEGRLPGWMVGAAIPLVGVASILMLAMMLGLTWSFVGAVASLKHR